MDDTRDQIKEQLLTNIKQAKGNPALMEAVSNFKEFIMALSIESNMEKK